MENDFVSLVNNLNVCYVFIHSDDVDTVNSAMVMYIILQYNIR